MNQSFNDIDVCVPDGAGNERGAMLTFNSSAELRPFQPNPIQFRTYGALVIHVECVAARDTMQNLISEPAGTIGVAIPTLNEIAKRFQVAMAAPNPKRFLSAPALQGGGVTGCNELEWSFLDRVAA